MQSLTKHRQTHPTPPKHQYNLWCTQRKFTSTLAHLHFAKVLILEARRHLQSNILGEPTSTPSAASLWRTTEARKVFWGEKQHGIVGAFPPQWHLNCTEAQLKALNCLTYPSIPPPNNGWKQMLRKKWTATPLVTAGLDVLFSASQRCTWSHPQTPEQSRWVANTVTSPGYQFTLRLS